MNYEAKINGMWYPVAIDGSFVQGNTICFNVYIKGFRAWNGTNCLMDRRSRVVFGPDSIRETTDDPLETVYPKEK